MPRRPRQGAAGAACVAHDGGPRCTPGGDAIANLPERAGLLIDAALTVITPGRGLLPSHAPTRPPLHHRGRGSPPGTGTTPAATSSASRAPAVAAATRGRHHQGVVRVVAVVVVSDPRQFGSWLEPDGPRSSPPCRSAAGGTRRGSSGAASSPTGLGQASGTVAIRECIAEEQGGRGPERPHRQVGTRSGGREAKKGQREEWSYDDAYASVSGENLASLPGMGWSRGRRIRARSSPLPGLVELKSQ